MIQLMGDRVLVQMDPLKVMSDGGIFYPNDDAVTEEDIHVWGTVLATGPGKWAKKAAKRVPMGVEVGDRVLFIRYLAKVQTNRSLSVFLEDGQIILEESDILCAEEK